MSIINSTTNINNTSNIILNALDGGGYNYSEWSQYTSIVLKAEGLWSDVIDPLFELDDDSNYIIPPAEDGSEQLLKDYAKSLGMSVQQLDEHKSRLYKAELIITLRVSRQVLNSIKSNGGADMWKQIRLLCTETSLAEIPRIINELIKFRMLDTDTIAQHEQKFNKLVSNATNAGVDVNDHYKNVHLKNSFDSVPYYQQRIREISIDELRNKVLYDTRDIFSYLRSAEVNRSTLTSNRLPQSRSDNTLFLLTEYALICNIAYNCVY